MIDVQRKSSVKISRMEKRRPLVANLPRGVSVYKQPNGQGTIFFRVRLGKKFTGGAVQHKDFKLLKNARGWIDEQKERRAQIVATGLSAAQLAEAVNAFHRLEGKSSLTEAVSFYLSHALPEGGVKTVEEVAAEYLQSREVRGVRARTYVQYESSYRVINARFGEEPINLLSQDELEDWIAESDWSPRTRANYIGAFAGLFRFAIQKEYCAKNIADHVPRPILDDRPPGILSVEGCRKLLTAANDYYPEMIPYIAIGLFTGLRRSELCALEWSNVDRETGLIEVTGRVAKTRQRRIVEIEPVLEKWLAQTSLPPRPAPSANADVCGSRLREVIEAAGIIDYPHNALRHSFGSYHLAQKKNENHTAEQMGNSPAVIFKHYRAVVRPSDARQFWDLTPEAMAQNSASFSVVLPAS